MGTDIKKKTITYTTPSYSSAPIQAPTPSRGWRDRLKNGRLAALKPILHLLIESLAKITMGSVIEEGFKVFMFH